MLLYIGLPAARLPLLNCHPPSPQLPPSLPPPPPFPPPPIPSLLFYLWVSGRLPTDAAGELNVLRHDGDALGVDGA